MVMMHEKWHKLIQMTSLIWTKRPIPYLHHSNQTEEKRAQRVNLCSIIHQWYYACHACCDCLSQWKVVTAHAHLQGKSDRWIAKNDLNLLCRILFLPTQHVDGRKGNEPMDWPCFYSLEAHKKSRHNAFVDPWCLLWPHDGINYEPVQGLKIKVQLISSGGSKLVDVIVNYPMKKDMPEKWEDWMFDWVAKNPQGSWPWSGSSGCIRSSVRKMLRPHWGKWTMNGF